MLEYEDQFFISGGVPNEAAISLYPFTHLTSLFTALILAHR